MELQPQAGRFLQFCRRFLAHDRPKVVAAFFLTFCQGALQGVGILMLVPLLAYVGVPDGSGEGPVTAIADFFFVDLGLPRSLPVILGVYVALVALRVVVERRRTLVETDLRLGFVRHLRIDLHDALLRAEWRFLAGARRSDFVQALTHDVARAGQAAYVILKMAAAVVLFTVLLAIAVRLSVPATLLTLAVTGALAWLLRDQLHAARESGKDLTSGANRLYSVVTQHLSGLAEIRSYGAEDRSGESFAEANREIDRVKMDFVREQTITRLWMTLGSVTILAGLLLAAVEVLRLPLASLLVLVYVFSRMLPQANQLQSQTLQLLNLLPAFESIDELLRRTRGLAEPEGAGHPPRLERAITLENVSFAHDPEDPTLSELTFEIPARRTTAVIGPSGAGKSTLALLLMGILVPDSGRISVDDTPIDSGVRRGWRGRVGYVPQETFLLHDTVRANLRLARPEAGEAELWEALELAAAASVVRELPEGLDTIVGDRGIRLSGGERQRVALARALVARPDLLLLDEATNSLDLESEARIFEALAGLHGRLTIVFITHRLGSLKHVDRVVVLEGGRVTEAGPRRVLAARSSSRLSAMSAPSKAGPHPST